MPEGAALSEGESSDLSGPFSRRETLIKGSILGLGIAMGERPASAEGDYVTFYGTAYPPGTYGQFDPDAANKAVYTFDYPVGWKPNPPTKSEKGRTFMDGRVVNPEVPGKKECAFVIVLSRAGEDNQSFKLKDTEQTFAGFSIADQDLQIALEEADEVLQSTREEAGLTFYDYEIKGPNLNYFSSITASRGRLFALFVKASSARMDVDRAALKNVVSTFKLTGRIPG
jgi:hypothetical protein